MKRLALVFVFGWMSGLVAIGQLQVDNTTTVEEALQILLGPGVVVSNVTFSGDLNQIGSFTGVGSNLGMDGGIILATGDCAFASVGMNNQGIGGNTEGFGSLGGGNWGVGDPDLEVVSGVTTNDAVILEFDFVALGEEIRFEYVFGSEEYNEFVCGTVNDAFGFFLSGPGINGPYSNNSINVAIVPGTNIPVTINTVNLGVPGGFYGPEECAAISPDWNQNSAYFVDNSAGQGSGVIQYDGFTVVLEASSPMICNETYHIKIAIADGGDASYDSGVFLKQGSFDSPGIIISADFTNTVTGETNSDNTIHENCGGAQITFERLGFTDLELVLEVEYSGTVENGVDIEELPSVIVFPAGESSVTIEVVPIIDGILEGTEELIVQITETGCNGESSTFSLFINDDPVQLSLDGNEPGCPNEEVTVLSTVTGGVEPYTYTWNTGATTPLLTDSYAVTETVSLNVTDACGTSVELPYLIEVPAPAPINVVVDGPFNVDCTGLLDLEPLVGGGTLPYSYAWSIDGAPLGTENDQVVDISGDHVVEFTVTDGCNEVLVTPIEVSLTVHPPIVVEQTEDPEICYGTSANLQVAVEGGFGPWTIEWTHNASTAWAATVQPNSDRVYPFTLTDGCGDTLEDSITVFVFDVTASFEFNFWSDTQISFTNTSDNHVLSFWEFGDGGTSEEDSPVHTYEEISVFTPVTLFVQSEQGCTDETLIILDPIMTAFVPNAFTPDNDGLNEIMEFVLVGVQNFRFQIFNRWGEVVFSTTERNRFWDGSVNGGDHYVPDGVYHWLLEMEGFESNTKRMTGTVTVIR